MKDAKQLKEELLYTKKTVYEVLGDDEATKAYDYAEGYKSYLDSSKTEREAVDTSIAMLEAKGFRPYALGDKVKAGDKLYYNNRGKSLYALTIGTESLEKGIRILASHIDSPRLDFKPCPVYEDCGI